MFSSIPHENIELKPDENDRKTFVTNVLKYKSLSKFKQLTDGLSNLIFALHSSENHRIIVKIYGKNSDLIVDRKAEIDFMTYVAKFHMGPQIVLTYKNGFIYKYVPGEPVQHDDTEKSLSIARTLAKFHSIPLINPNLQGQLVEKLRHYINLLSGLNNELYKRIKLSSTPFLNDISWSKINKDIDRMEKIFNEPNSPWSKLAIVVCHNDTQTLNFLSDDDHQQLTLIDFEHCARNFWLYDVFNYFLEYAGFESEEPDFDQAYPTREQQKRWLEVYFRHATFLNDKFEKTLTIDQLCDLGDQLRAPIHLYWSLWSFLEALLNTDVMKKFDYVKYGKWRLNEYEKSKHEFFFSSSNLIKSNHDNHRAIE